MTSKNPSFDSNMQKLEGILSELNQPQLPLEEVLNKVESGYQLILSLRAQLDQAKMRVEELRDHFIQKSDDTKSVEIQWVLAQEN